MTLTRGGWGWDGSDQSSVCWVLVTLVLLLQVDFGNLQGIKSSKNEDFRTHSFKQADCTTSGVKKRRKRGERKAREVK